MINAKLAQGGTSNILKRARQYLVRDLNMPLPSEESTGEGSPDDIEFKERVDSRLIHEATEYLKR